MAANAYLFIGDENMGGSNWARILDDTDHEDYTFHQTIKTQADVFTFDAAIWGVSPYDATTIGASNPGGNRQAFGAEASASRAIADAVGADIYMMKDTWDTSMLSHRTPVSVDSAWLPGGIYGFGHWPPFILSTFQQAAQAHSTAAATGTVSFEAVFFAIGSNDATFWWQYFSTTWKAKLASFIALVRGAFGNGTLPFIMPLVPGTGQVIEEINERLVEVVGPDGSVANTGVWGLQGVDQAYGKITDQGVIDLGTGLATCLDSGMTETNM